MISSRTLPFRAAPLVAVLACVASLTTTSARAQPVPRLAAPAPIYLKQSETREVTLGGANLGGATKVFLTDPCGLTAELVGAADPATQPAGRPAGKRGTKKADANIDPATDKNSTDKNSTDKNSTDKNAASKNAAAAAAPADRVVLKLTAAADAGLGVRELRVVTPLGVTAPLFVTVGQFPATLDQEPKDAPNAAGQAPTVAFPTSIVGRIDVGGDVDDYRFDARRGQRLVFDLHAGRLNSALDPVLLVLDAAGREQRRTVSFRDGGDPTIVFEPPADGSYTLQVRDVQYRGGTDYAYRIDAGEIPFVESILPAGGLRGGKVEVRAVGHNLGSHTAQTVDLTDAQPGKIDLRFKTPAGWSNDVSFAVTAVAQLAEPGKNNTAASAAPVSLPAEVSGVLAEASEEDFFRFSVPMKQAVTIEVQGRRIGSPIDALLTLRDAKGEVVERSNGAGEAEARISRPLEPGDYVVSVRDLTFAGGPAYGYRLSVLLAAAVPADFVVRFMPDAPRVARGGHAKVWCEVVRLNGYKGDVAVTLDGLPPGVTVTNGPVTIGEQTSGLFTLSAAADAPLTSAPVKLRAVGSFGAQQTIRFGEPELNGKTVRAAYLSVLDAAPFTVESLAQIKPEQIASYPGDVQKLFAKLNSASPELEKSQAEWEQKIGTAPEWRTLDVTAAKAASGVELKKQADGTLLQSGKSAERDTFTVAGPATLKQVAAVRLEVLTDPSLPGNGPGRNASGNFVLSKFVATVAPKSDPSKATPIKFTAAKATFEQPNYGVAGAVDDDPAGGWAIFGGTGTPQTAWFLPDKPVPAGDVMLTFTLDQQFGQEHTVGRFRLSVTDDPEAPKRQGEALPGTVAGVLKTPADKRSPEQKAQLAAYYRSIAPELQADRGRLEALRNSVGPFAEVARLENVLRTDTPALDQERKEWEAAAAAGIGWSAVEVSNAKSANGSVLTKEKDDSVTAAGAVPPTDVYTIAASTPLRTITAVRLEALSDERLPSNGPGRSAEGNFILTRFAVGVTPGAAGNPVAAVALREARASFEQANYPVAAALDDKPDTGWAVSPMMGRPASATFFPKVPIVAADGGARLTFTLEFNSPAYAGFSLGRFRLWVLGAADPASAPNIPAEVQDILKVADANRTPEQRVELAAYYRSISPALEPTRQRLAELRARVPQMPIVVARNRGGAIPVPVNRSAAFAGPVQVTLEGFSAGRDPQTRQPTPVAKNFDVTPLTLAPDAAFGKLAFKPRNNSELGTRMVVLRAEAKIGDDTYVQYSPAFPITVTEK